MFILDGGLAKITTSQVNKIYKSDDEDEQEKKPSRTPSENVTFGTVEESNPVIEKGDIPAKLLLAERVIKKLALLSLTDEQKNEIAKLISENFDDSKASKITRYLSDDKYEFYVTAHDKTIEDIHSTFSDVFGEEYAKWLEVKLQFDKETREIEKVMTVLSFSTSNPIGVISALKNLLSSLTTASALEMAGSGIKDVASFAADQFIKEAKYNPDDARKNAQALSAVTNSIPGHVGAGHGVNGDLHTDSGVGHIEGEVPHVESHGHSESISSRTITVVDKETNEVVEEFVAYRESYDDHENEDLHEAAHSTVNTAFSSVDSARKSSYEVDRIADDLEKEKTQKDIALANSSDQREIRELTAKERARSSFIGYA